MIGSPLIVLQLALYGYMTYYGLQATFRVFSSPLGKWTYALLIVCDLILAISALMKTYMLEPGNVSTALVEKLKN